MPLTGVHQQLVFLADDDCTDQFFLTRYVYSAAFENKLSIKTCVSFCEEDFENMKEMPSKVAHNRRPTFFHVLARLLRWPRNRNVVPPKAHCVMQDWIFRLGLIL